MTETTCRWDREAQAYMRHGEPCKTDDYGDPTRHCEAKQGCANHVGRGEKTCARCIWRARGDIRAILNRIPDLLPEAITGGITSQAASLAGPACNVEAWSWRKIAARQGRAWHASLPVELGGDPQHVEEDDDRHPFTVLTRLHWDIATHYGHDFPDVFTLTGSADYLERMLPRIAQDPDLDFRDIRDAIRKCRNHVDGVLRDSLQPERGVECPVCETKPPRLTLTHGHWCLDPECSRMHYPEDPDVWVCPRNREHAWTEEDYRRWVADVYEANRSAS